MDPTELGWFLVTAHHDEQVHLMHVHQHPLDANRPVESTLAWTVLMEGKRLGGGSTERTLSLREEDPLSDINRACAIADASTAD